MNPFTISILLLLLSYPLLCSSFDFTSFDPKELLSVSCEFSTLVSREKRDLSGEEEPNLHDPAALLSYLYPLANVPVSDVNKETSRSVDQQPSWLEDLAQTWRIIWCNKKKRSRRTHRRQRRSSPVGNARRIVKRDEDSSSASGIGDLVTWAGYLGNVSSSYLTPPAEMEEETTESSEEGEEKQDDSESVEDEEGYEKEEKSEEDEEDSKSDEEEDEEEEEETTTTTTAAPTPAPEDPYFASYGGDVECFIPLISFTIPFDGEITLLGFHGFKGMFPY